MVEMMSPSRCHQCEKLLQTYLMASANLSRVSKKLLELLVEREMDVFDGVWKKYGGGDSDEGDRHSNPIVISIPGST
jgi:hypothetical protein